MHLLYLCISMDPPHRSSKFVFNLSIWVTFCARTPLGRYPPKVMRKTHRKNLSSRGPNLLGSSDDCFITFGSPSSEVESTSQECCDINRFVRNSSGSVDSPAPKSAQKYSQIKFFDNSDEFSEDEDVDADSDSDWDEIDHSNDKFDEETWPCLQIPSWQLDPAVKKE